MIRNKDDKVREKLVLSPLLDALQCFRYFRILPTPKFCQTFVHFNGRHTCKPELIFDAPNGCTTNNFFSRHFNILCVFGTCGGMGAETHI